MTASILVLLLAMQEGEAREMKDLFERARREHQLGNYEAAATTFSDVYRKTGDPTMLFNAAQSLRLAGRSPEALAAYRGYLRDRPDAPNRPLVESKIAELLAEAAPRGGAPARAAPAQSGPPRATDADIVEPQPASKRIHATKPVPPAALAMNPMPSPPASESPQKHKWWLWATIGAVVVTGTVVTVAVASRRPDVPGTPLGNQGIFR